MTFSVETLVEMLVETFSFLLTFFNCTTGLFSDILQKIWSLFYHHDITVETSVDATVETNRLKPPFQPSFYANKKRSHISVTPSFSVSGYQDSNLGPPAPKAYYYYHHFYIQTSEYQYFNSNIF